MQHSVQSTDTLDGDELMDREIQQGLGGGKMMMGKLKGKSGMKMEGVLKETDES